MKYFFIAMCFIIFFSPKTSTFGNEPQELYFFTDVPNDTTYIMTLTLTCLSGSFWSGVTYVGTPWSYINPTANSSFYSSSYKPAANNEGGGVDGWNFISTPPGSSRNLGYGIYKVTNDRNDFYFYINYFD